MSIIRFEFPLRWPAGIPMTPRNQQRIDHGFPTSLTLNESIGYLDRELLELHVSQASMSMDMEQPLVERLRRKTGSFTGTELRFKYQGVAYQMTCDRWQKLEHNIYSLHLAIRQWRCIERWGVGSLNVSMAGFAVNASRV